MYYNFLVDYAKEMKFIASTCVFIDYNCLEYDSVLSQQSISGKIVSLVLCVWKLGFFQTKSHMNTVQLQNAKL